MRRLALGLFLCVAIAGCDKAEDGVETQVGAYSLFDPAAVNPSLCGAPAIPLILRRLAARGGQWFAALRSLTGENPVPAGDRGDIEAITRAWLRWGDEHGYSRT